MVSGQDTIAWNLYNKITRAVNKTGSSEMTFGYDGAGNRVRKSVIKYNAARTQKRVHTDYYVRDAQGNILATYQAVDTFALTGGAWVL